ncbi:ribosomal protein S18-alanine N-acetyltransferase [Spongiibacter sp. KMU-158]|uniref:Ribosomal protein S18-alanine N-acetyltransferase n=1 Tax=Spongiibacter pelagi TaxID=2760804 RepID=A0A927GVY4_9GAMM|nr:ribosomal protein S18-alanine N-acetyltransferase [Spongiibacter pelagi]MBD2858377.1 ribosomal protein S18-alanine N-acetyltransferase [Spongiibacter pelagi]
MNISAAELVSAPFSLREFGSPDLALCDRFSKHSDPHSWSLANWKHSLQGDTCLGLYEQETLLAVVAFSLVLDELSLLNIVVDRDQRGRGLGKILLLAGLEWMQQFGAQRCVLEVRESNDSARALYRKLGFTEDGLRRNYYPLDGGHEHAVLMSADLPLE